MTDQPQNTSPSKDHRPRSGSKTLKDLFRFRRKSVGTPTGSEFSLPDASNQPALSTSASHVARPRFEFQSQTSAIQVDDSSAEPPSPPSTSSDPVRSPTDQTTIRQGQLPEMVDTGLERESDDRHFRCDVIVDPSKHQSSVESTPDEPYPAGEPWGEKG